MTTLVFISVLIVVALTLAYVDAGGLAYLVVAGVVAAAMTSLPIHPALAAVAWILVVALAALNNTGLRRRWIAKPMLRYFQRSLPKVSRTEQEALDAGTVWWDGELFSGRPDWNKLLAYPRANVLSEAEQAFVNGPLQKLCSMLDDWQITHELNDLPPEVWRFIRDEGFFGLIIPKEYGGKGFSALAQSEIVTIIASRSGSAAVTVMVPNSLGPAELLLHYGTAEQRQHYLPRLAKGVEIPCFALTGPEAGSDAGAIPDRGVVCRGEFRGEKDVLGIRLNWEKRYITLGPVATLLGLAFKLYDPDHLLGDKLDIGITLALIPTDTPGIRIGSRHYPLNMSFQNGPNWGQDVFIPMDWVIGGVDRVGQGWRMLMDCLAVGRAISLPALGTGSAKLAARATGAYAHVRRQFNIPIGEFEGVEEMLARIGGNAYIMEGARRMTALAVDLGEKPSVASAIVKYHLTERGRAALNDAMDVHGGKGVCMGPGNYLARLYQGVPVNITVEGANILTRNLMIFGQGAIRCHPYILKEIRAANDPNETAALAVFDGVFCQHVRFGVGNAVRALVLGLTGARFAAVPGGVTRRYFQQLSRVAAGFALCADLVMLIMGGELKRRERTSARLGDILSQLYLCSAALKRFEDDGRQAEDLPLLQWGLENGLRCAQDAFEAVFDNFQNRWIAGLMRWFVFPLGRSFRGPGDTLEHEVAQRLMQPGAVRDRLTAGIYVPTGTEEALGRLEIAFAAAHAAAPVEAKLRLARKTVGVRGASIEETVQAALTANIITASEAGLVLEASAARRAAIRVDDFNADGKASAHDSIPGRARAMPRAMTS